METKAQTKGALHRIIEDEVLNFTTRVVKIGEQYNYSQYKLTRRISLFETHTYPTGKFDAQGNYKYWFDIISTRIDTEVKNIDFTTSNISVYSPRKEDELLDIIANLALQKYLRDTGQTEEINEAIESGSGWGNVVWKKIKEGYEDVDLRNFYVINQSAEELDDTPVIERHEYTEADLRVKKGVWDNIQEVIEIGKKSRKEHAEDYQNDTTVPYFEIYERNGEVSVQALKEYKGETVKDGDDKEFIFCKIIAYGESTTSGGVAIKFILFAEEMKGKSNCDIYKEFHRGRYKGKWFREGIYELLFDLQVRANQIGNQLAQGLEYASKVIYRSADKLIIQNILTDIMNGDIIRSSDLQQVPVVMEGFSQLIAEWNNVMDLANQLANSNPIVMGQFPQQRISAQVMNMVQANAMKLYQYVRSKFAAPYSEMFHDWVIPNMLKKLKTEDIIHLSGDPDLLDRFMESIVDSWYLDNLIAIGPHDQQIADELKQEKLDELKSRPKLLVKNMSKMWDDYLPNIEINIVNNNSMKEVKVASYETFIPLVQDPIRREAMIEKAMEMVGIDVRSLPSTPPQQPQMPEQPPQPGQGGKPKQEQNPNSPPSPLGTPQPPLQPGQRPMPQRMPAMAR